MTSDVFMTHRLSKKARGFLGPFSFHRKVAVRRVPTSFATELALKTESHQWPSVGNCHEIFHNVTCPQLGGAVNRRTSVIGSAAERSGGLRGNVAAHLITLGIRLVVLDSLFSE